MPYPPNFRRIAAKIIDPAIGASTWAFGNHRCTVNIGSLTKNPPMAKTQAKEDEEKSLGNSILINIGIIAVFEVMKILHRIINMGSEAATV
jgi:hypothetical protein